MKLTLFVFQYFTILTNSPYSNTPFLSPSNITNSLTELSHFSHLYYPLIHSNYYTLLAAVKDSSRQKVNVDADTQAILDDYGIELGGSDSSDSVDSPKTVSSDRSSGISCFTKSCLLVASTGGAQLAILLQIELCVWISTLFLAQSSLINSNYEYWLRFTHKKGLLYLVIVIVYDCECYLCVS